MHLLKHKFFILCTISAVLLSGCTAVDEMTSNISSSIQSGINSVSDSINGNGGRNATSANNLNDFRTWLNTSSTMKSHTLNGLALSSFRAEESAINGLYVLIHPTTGKRSAFITSDLNYYKDFSGWVDLSNNGFQEIKNQSLTRNLMQRYVISNLDLSQTMSYQFGNNRATAILFSGVDCPSSKSFENYLKNNGQEFGGTMYIMPMALQARNEQNIQNIICSRNPSETWQTAILSGQRVSAANTSSCSLNRQIALRDDLKILLTIKEYPMIYSINKNQLFSVPSNSNARKNLLRSLQ